MIATARTVSRKRSRAPPDAVGASVTRRGGTVRGRAETEVISIDATDIGRSWAFGRGSRAPIGYPLGPEGEYPLRDDAVITSGPCRSGVVGPFRAGRDLRFTQ